MQPAFAFGKGEATFPELKVLVISNVNLNSDQLVLRYAPRFAHLLSGFAGRLVSAVSKLQSVHVVKGFGLRV